MSQNGFEALGDKKSVPVSLAFEESVSGDGGWADGI